MLLLFSQPGAPQSAGAAILPARPWTRQPQGPVEIDWSNPLTQGLWAVAFPTMGPWTGEREIVSKKTFANSGGPAESTFANGMRAWKPSIYSGPLFIASGGVPNGINNPIEYQGLFSLTQAGVSAASTPGSGFYLFGNSNTNGIGFGVQNVGGVLVPRFRNGSLDDLTQSGFEGVDYTLTGTTALQADRLYSGSIVLIDGRYPGGPMTGQEMQVGLNGKIEATARYAQFEGANSYFCVAPYSGTSTDSFRTYVVAAWARHRSEAERLEFHRNPWQIFRPIARRIYVGAALSSTPVTIACVRGAIGAAGKAATLAQAVTIAAAVGTGLARGQQASVAAQTTISCAAGRAGAAGRAAALAAPASIACASGRVGASGRSAAVSQSTAIAALTGRAGAAGKASAITAATTIGCAAGRVGAAGKAASLGLQVTVTCAVGQVGASGRAAVLAQSATIGCAAGRIGAAGRAATLAGAATLGCAVGRAGAAGRAASIPVNATLSCGRASAGAAGRQSSIGVATTMACSTGRTGAAGRPAQLQVASTLGCARARVGAGTRSASLRFDATVQALRARAGAQASPCAVNGGGAAGGFIATVARTLSPAAGVRRAMSPRVGRSRTLR